MATANGGVARMQGGGDAGARTKDESLSLAAGKWKICLHFRGARGPNVFCIICLSQAKDLLSYLTHTKHTATHAHTHTRISTYIRRKHRPFAYGHSFRSDFCFTLPIWKLWLYFTPSHMHTHAHSETFCLAATSIVVFCGHVNALPRPPPTAHQRPVTPPHCCCYCEAFFLISTLHAAHCFAFVSSSLFFQTNWVST